MSSAPRRHPLLEAVAPVAAAVGAVLVEAGEVEPGDVPLRWEGELVGGVRIGGLQGAIERMVARAERQLGTPVAEMTREQKQEVVRLLDEAGAFTLRRAVEDVADLLGVSRFTVYNYLHATKERP